MKRQVTPQPVPGDERAALFVTDVSNLQRGPVTKAPGTVGPMLEYGVVTHAEVVEEGVLVRLAEPHSWTDHGPRIRDAIRLAVDLEGWG